MSGGYEMSVRMMSDKELKEVLRADKNRQALQPQKRKSNVIELRRKQYGNM